MTPKQILVAHIEEFHWNIMNPGRKTYAELQTRHARDHWHSYQRHYHDPTKRPDLSRNPGPGNRPDGWRTGEDVVVIHERGESLRRIG